MATSSKSKAKAGRQADPPKLILQKQTVKDLKRILGAVSSKKQSKTVCVA
jgi:hypothetical protein